MRAFSGQGVLFSDQHFSEETIAWLLQSPREMRAQALPPAPKVTQNTPDSAYAAAWAEMSKDPELMKAVQQAGYSQDKGLADFSKAIAAPLSNSADMQLSASLKVDYVTTVEGGKFVHRLNGEPILSIPSNLDSAAAASANAEAIMYAIFMVIDVVCIVIAAVGVSVTVQKNALAKTLQTPLQRFLRVFTTTAAAAELKQLEETGKKIEMIMKILTWLRGSTNLKDVFKLFLKSLSWAQIAIAVVQLIAAVLLMISTAGASLAAKILQLAAAIALFITDVVSFVLALQKKK
jgi:hypothetical protein